MRFIVSPAKKMNVVDDAFGWRDLPMFADRAARLADAVRALSYDEAKAPWQCRTLQWPACLHCSGS